MRKILIYLLILVLSIPILSPWGTITYFVVNRDYIKTTLCENKSRPELQCDGKCYLARKLKKQQEAAEKEAIEIIKGLSWSCLFVQDFQKVDFKITFYSSENKAWDHTSRALCSAFPRGIFRPPKLG